MTNGILPKKKIKKEAERIITTAAKLILGDIRSVKYDCEHYPTYADIDNSNKGKSWLPHTLKTFLEVLLKSLLN